MTPDFFKRVDQIFTAARELEPAARSALLDRECGMDAALRAEVAGLLAHDDTPEDYFRTPALGAVLQMITAGGSRKNVATLNTPQRIGRYRIIKVIGEGGFGVVYLAEQDNPRRTVAVKVVKAHLATPAMLRRFEYEAQVLGRLQHPAIAQIHEAGVFDGREMGVGKLAFFAMEYIEGTPLDQFLRNRPLALPDKLELLAKICDAVQYAHQRGVIHRDLKPSNILVVEPRSDSALDATKQHVGAASPSALRRLMTDLMPKILDFGVARTTDGDQQLTTMGTSVGELVGTLPYMSPEQVIGNPDEVDTRADVYSLGVIVYQALSGLLPHDFRSCAIPEAARRIREEAPRRLGTIDRVYRGEIEIIVSKAMEKDRHRRYQTASDFAADLRRFISGEPIEARRDSALYVLRKTLTRYRGALYAGATMFMLVVIFAVYASILAKSNADMAESEATARKDAQAALTQTQTAKHAEEEARRSAEDKLCVSNIERGRLLGVTENMAAAEPLLWNEYFKNPSSRHAYWALWELYSHQPTLMHILAHEKQINKVRVSPDGAFAITASVDGFIRKWDLQTTRMLAEAPIGAGGSVMGMDMNPAGTLATFFITSGELVFWDTVGWGELRRLRAHGATGACTDFSNDGALLATCGGDDRIVIWDVATKTPLAEACGLQAGCATVRFSPDGRRLATTGLNGSVALWNIRRGGDGPPAIERYRTMVGHRGPIGPLAFRPDGLQLASGGRDRSVRVWDAFSGECIKAFTPSNGTIRALAYSEDGSRLFVGGWWSVDLHDADTFARERGLAIPSGIYDLALAHDGRLLTVADLTLRVWETTPAGAFRPLREADERVAGVDRSVDDRFLYTMSSDNVLRVRDINSLHVVRKIPISGTTSSVRVNRDQRRALVTLRTNEAVLVDLESGAVIAKYAGSASPGCAAAFAPDGKTLALGGADGSIRVIDAQSGEVRRTVPPECGEMIWLRYSPDGSVIATIGREPAVRIRDAETWEDVALLPGFNRAQPWCVDFSPDGKVLAAGGWHKAIELWDWRARRRTALLEGHTQLITSIQYERTAGEPLLATTSNDGAVKLWDPRLEVCLATLDARGGDAFCISFLPPRAGQANAAGRVAVGYMNAGFGVWDLSYYDRHIAGNASLQIDMLSLKFGDEFDAASARRTADALLQRYWTAPR